MLFHMSLKTVFSFELSLAIEDITQIQLVHLYYLLIKYNKMKSLYFQN